MLRKFAPNLRVQSIYHIDLQLLRAAGIKGVITDLDNTLVKTRDPHADDQVAAWFQHLLSEGFKVVIVSNNNRRRVAKFCHPLGIPFVHGARKPTSRGFRKSLNMLGIAAAETAMIGDQLLTDVYGGNRMGMYTILVEPCSFEGEKWTTKVNRLVEKFAIRQLRKKGMFPKEEAR